MPSRQPAIYLRLQFDLLPGRMAKEFTIVPVSVLEQPLDEHYSGERDDRVFEVKVTQTEMRALYEKLDKFFGRRGLESTP